MKTKAEIVENWLPRYTQHPLSDFGEYILLTNFNNYVDIFCEQFKLPQPGYGANMRMATAENITIINFGMGSPNAAIIMDLLSAIEPKACLFLGKCGGISSKTKLGDLILPLAGIRWRGDIERLLSARGACVAGFHAPAGGVDSHTGCPSRLLDGHGVHYEP